MDQDNNSGRLTPDDVVRSLQLVQMVFREFRSLVLGRAGKTEYTDKRDGSPVTETDMEIEVALQAAMAKQFPGVPVFGEETGYGDELPHTFWLVDPLDGTQAFIEGKPTFTSMAVLIQDGEAMASVIYNPSTDEMYVAQKEKGAHKNDVPLDLRKVPMSHKALTRGHLADIIGALLKPQGVTCETAPMGSGYGFTMVADGLAGARFNLQGRGHTHDYAPGGLLVREAGGVLIPILNDSYTYETRSFVACHPDFEKLVRPHLQELRAIETEGSER